jgi:GDP-fucose transporter C1
MSSRAGNLPLPALSRGAFMLNHQKMTSVVVISYVVFSLFATLLNKTLYTFSEYKFPYPLFTVLFQSIIAFILITIWSRVKPL